jgi:hypothetical protein
MRSTICLALTALGLIVLPARAAEAGDGVWTVTVTGYGVDEAGAEEHALDRARDQVAIYLTRELPDLAWRPDAAYLLRAGIAQRAGPAEPVEPPPRSGQGVKVNILLTIGAKQLDELRRTAQQEAARQETVARQERVEKRQRGAVVGLVAAVLALLVIGGYLRLEEATRGYSTGLLRAAAVTILVLLVAGAWVVL